MNRVLARMLVAFGLLAIGLGCNRSGEAEAGDEADAALHVEASLAPVEVFVWDDQPIVFRPPNDDWERQKEQSGGLLGVRFVRTGSGGERIHVAEFRRSGERDRCSELSGIVEDLETLTPREFATRIVRARPPLSSPINASESEGFENAVELLREAELAHREGDLDRVRERIQTALLHLGRVEYELEEVVEPALFTGEGWEALGRISVAEPVGTAVAGEPALSLDYEFVPHDRERAFLGREYYVEFNNRLFVASFQGFEATLPVFDALVASIAFEAGPCEH